MNQDFIYKCNKQKLSQNNTIHINFVNKCNKKGARYHPMIIQICLLCHHQPMEN